MTREQEFKEFLDLECECCRHYPHGELEDPCCRCVACGEWCEGCGEIAILHDSGFCSDCCEGCSCGEGLDWEAADDEEEEEEDDEDEEVR